MQVAMTVSALISLF